MAKIPLLQYPGIPWNLDVLWMALVYVGIGYFYKSLIREIIEDDSMCFDMLVVGIAIILGIFGFFNYREGYFFYYFDMKPVYYKELLSAILIPCSFGIVLVRGVHGLVRIKCLNRIYLDRNADGLTRQVQRNEQTFGANIHALYQNAFFLNDGLAMGKFAQERINIWIEEAEKANPQKMKQIINMIGEPLICRELRKIIGRRQETIREKAKNEEHMMMLRFLKQQKAEIERQIKILEEEYSD